MKMPNQLVFPSGLPFEWLSTRSYAKALEWYNKHNPNTKPMIWAQSPTTFYVLTSHGEGIFKKITKKLVTAYHLCVHTLRPAQLCINAYLFVSCAYQICIT